MMIQKQIFSQTIKSNEFDQWMDTKKDEIMSMKINQVWELVELLNGFTLVQSK